MPRKPPTRLPGSSGPSLTRPARPADDAGSAISPREGAPRRHGGSGKGGGGRKRPGNMKRAPLWARFYRFWFNRRAVMALISLLLTFAIVGLIGVAYVAHKLPDISNLDAAHKTLGIQVLAADGQLIKNYGDIYGDQLAYDEFPKTLIDAVLSTEDRKFFRHFGIDPLGIARAMLANLMHGHMVQGGSTITQQLAKNVFLTPEKTAKRKLEEMALALWIESHYTKKQILSIYLNRVYMGAGNYGVDAASRHYFGKSARQMNLAESAMIAGLLKAPSKYSPTSDIDLAKNRAHQVLLNMVDAGTLTQAKADSAFEHFEIPQTMATSEERSGRYFSDWVVDQLPDLLPNLEDDIIIKTTLEPVIQKDAEQALDTVLTPEAMQKARVSQTALVSMHPDGAIVAMIGGRDYAKSQYNRATQAKRQPGSSFKMFVYLTAFEHGYRPDQMVTDEPVTISTPSGPWTPHNYENEHLGTVPLREAVAKSLNTVAVQVSQAVGIGNIVTTARRMGITADLDEVPALALGAAEISPLEMTGAYAHLASGGMGVRPYGIAEIHRKRDGQLMFERRDTGAYLVVQRNIVAMMNTVLEDVIAEGTGRSAAIGRPAAGKTGTTSDYKDAWFIGYTPDLVTGVWVGNDDNTSTNKITGGKLPALIWSNYMRKAEAGVAPVPLPTDYEGGAAPLPWLQQAPGTPGEASPAMAPDSQATYGAAPFGGPTPPLPAPAPVQAPITYVAPGSAYRPGAVYVAPPAPASASDGTGLGEDFWNKMKEGGERADRYNAEKRQ